jgi:hypothetical protein
MYGTPLFWIISRINFNEEIYDKFVNKKGDKHHPLSGGYLSPTYRSFNNKV